MDFLPRFTGIEVYYTSKPVNPETQPKHWDLCPFRGQHAKRSPGASESRRFKDKKPSSITPLRPPRAR
eukprot:8317380-Alexandrium_andersonii.AAC.1